MVFMISVIIPAFNEEKHIQDTVVNVLRAGEAAGSVPLEIIVVNDGSNDRTAEILAQLEKNHPNLRTITHPNNVGIGESIKDALKLVKYPKLLIVPGDNDLPAESIERLFKNKDKADLVLMFLINRELRGRFRNVVSIVYGLIYMCVFNVFLLYINSPCIYPTEKLKGFNIRSKRFSIITEITIKCLRSGCTFHEIPGYLQRGLIGSSALKFKNLVEVLWMFLQLVWEVLVTRRQYFNKKPVRVY
jgi:glycosyltransferase involved in cell wall biosynthesis